MSLRKTFFVICLTILVLCLAVGYWIPGQWIGAMLVILMGPAWLLARKYPDSGFPLVCLLGSVSFAVAGALIGAPPFLMMVGSTFALAVWDLLFLDAALGNQSALEQTRHYENNHLQSLMMALGFGLLGTVLGSFLKTRIPFIILMLLITFLLVALDRLWGYLKNIAKR